MDGMDVSTETKTVLTGIIIHPQNGVDMLNKLVGAILLYFIVGFTIFIIPEEYHTMLLAISISYILMDVVSKLWKN